MGIDRRLSITYIIGQLGLGGSEKQLYMLARELVSRQWRVSVFNLNPAGINYWAQPLQQLGVTVHSLPQNYSQLARLIMITKLLADGNPDIVHSWSFFTNIYASLCGTLARIPICLGSERGSWAYSKRSYGRIRYSLSLLGLQGLVTNSEIEAGYLKIEKPGLKVEVIPNGVDENGLFSRKEARFFWGIPEETVLLAAIGSLTPNKNFTFLIEVFARLSVLYPSLKLLLIGDGPEKEALEKMAANLGVLDRIDFKGHVPEVFKVLKGIDILCIPSLTEGMPNVVLEAFVAGIPVVANKVGMIPSLIADGCNGYLVEVGDGSGFTDSLKRLICDEILRRSMGESGRKLIQMEFAPQKMADRFVSFYQEMINS